MSKSIEDVLCSKLRLKILKMLLQLGQLNGSDIACRLSVNYQITIEHLRILEESKIVQSRLFGRTHLFKLSSSQRAFAVQKVLEAWEEKSARKTR